MSKITPDQRKNFNDEVIYNYGGATLTGNLIVPSKYFPTLNFDESIVGHGGDDLDIGMNCDKNKIGAIFTEKTRGYHLAHPVVDSANRNDLGNTIIYLHEKYDKPMPESFYTYFADRIQP